MSSSGTMAGVEGAVPATLGLELDRDHPTPLYHQIVQAVRWKIGTGALPPGSLLPSLRDGASAWQVSYHTVRRAYRELGELGLVESVRGDGTRVLERPDAVAPDGSPSAPGRTVGAGSPTDSPDVFVRKMIGAARARFGMAPHELAELVARASAGSSRLRVAMVECNDHQSEDLARQLESHLGVESVPWNLDRRGEPPPGPIVGTWFHVAEMRRRWPDRIGSMHFAALRLDPRIVERVRRGLAEGAAPPVLVEKDVGTGRQHAADLVAAVPEMPRPEVRTALPSAEEVDGSGVLWVIAPRLWDGLEPDLRDHSRVIELRHVFDDAHLEQVGRALGIG